MTTQDLPTIPGLTYPLRRKPIFKTRKQVSISGFVTRIADWAFPRYQWELAYSALRQGTLVGSWSEFATLEGFFEQMQGAFASFLFQDPDDFTVTTQVIGTGTGAQTVFPLVRTFGGASGPVLAPNLGGTINVYLNAVLQGGGTYTVTPWNTGNVNGPGQLIFNSAPGNTVAITMDYTYYFPCCFDDDSLDFEKFMSNLYSLKKMTFTSLKNGS